MENKKYCPKCGYECEADYVFCARCGATLPLIVAEQPQQQQSQPQQPFDQPPAYSQPPIQPPVQPPIYAQPPVQQPIVPPTEPQNTDDYRYNYDGNVIAYDKTLNGIPTAEVSDYIGKNRHRFLTKFFKQSFGAKGSWNWMAFLFGVIGIPFVWFFYRKMKKQGIITLIIALIISLATGLTYGGMAYAVSEPAKEYCETIAELNKEYGYYDSLDFDVPFVNPEADDPNYTINVDAAYNDFMVAANKNNVYRALTMVTQILSYINIAFAITVAIFADHWYYKKAMADLNELNRAGTPDSETVMAKGGTKTSAAVLSGILGALAITFVTVMAMVPFALPLLESIMKIML